MAKAKPDTAVAVAAETSTAVAAVADQDIFAHAGFGIEGTTADDFAIPFLSVLQKGSPQCDEEDGAFIEGAKAGMFFDNVNMRMFDGKAGVRFVPVAYRRVYLHWGARGTEGAGFKGELSVEQVEKMRDQGLIKEMDGKLLMPLPDGSLHEKKSDRVSDTRNWYVLLLDEDGSWRTALISLTSTQIKKSKVLMSMIQSVKVKDGAGVPRPVAPYWNVIRASTVGESNDKGTWHGWRFERVGDTAGMKQLHAEAVAFAESIRAGRVQARYEEPAGGGDAGGGERDGF